MPEQLTTITDAGMIEQQRSISEFDAKIAIDLEATYKQIRTIPELGDSIALGGGHPEGLIVKEGNIEVRTEGVKTAGQLFEESCAVTSDNADTSSVQLIRSYDLRRGDDAEGHFRVRRFEAVSGEVSEYAIEPTHADSETRPVTIYQPDGQIRTEDYATLDYELEVTGIVDELHAGIDQIAQPAPAPEQLAA